MPGLRDARLTATNPRDGLVPVVLVDAPGRDRSDWLCRETTLTRPTPDPSVAAAELDRPPVSGLHTLAGPGGLPGIDGRRVLWASGLAPAGRLGASAACNRAVA